LIDKHVGNYQIKQIFIINLDPVVHQMDHSMLDNVINHNRNVGVLPQLVFILLDLNQNQEKMLIAVDIFYSVNQKNNFFSF
jgi:hypothetical protein